MSLLFSPLSLRSVVLPNRVGIPPMCQYTAQDGLAGDWHFVHYGSRAVGGAGLIIVEATAVLPEGRISRGDLGLWNDAQVEPLARLAAFMAAHGSVPRRKNRLYRSRECRSRRIETKGERPGGRTAAAQAFSCAGGVGARGWGRGGKRVGVLWNK